MKDYYPVELFHWAGMKDEHIYELKNILDRHPEYVHETNSFGDNCLFIAVRAGNIEMAKYIIENTDVDINHQAKNKKGMPNGNVLLEASSNGNVKIVEYLLEKTKIDIHTKNNLGQGVYHLCANRGDSDLIEKILQIDLKKSIGDLDSKGRHCLFNLIGNYKFHQNYWCFEVIQQELSLEQLLREDKNGLNIFEFSKKLQKKIPQLERLLTPLINILNSRLLHNDLNNNLENKERYQEKNYSVKV